MSAPKLTAAQVRALGMSEIESGDPAMRKACEELVELGFMTKRPGWWHWRFTPTAAGRTALAAAEGSAGR